MEQTRDFRPPRPWGELPRGAVTAEHGLVVVDKNPDVTSHDVVGAMRRLAATRKVGHAGTLDPMATGVLCIGIGKATKLLQYVTGTDKEYRATVRLGIDTHTEDAQGEVAATRGAPSEDLPGTVSRIDSVIASLTGDIMQRPSSVSAVKVDGKRAYARVREGESVQLDARPIHVERFERMGEPRPDITSGIPVLDVDVVVQCSAGTYIRALARDLGAALGTGGHLTALRRTRVGTWGEDQARTVSQLAEIVSRGEPLPVVGLAALCHGLFPCVEVSPSEADSLAHGQFIAGRTVDTAPAAAMCDGTAVALISRRGTKMKPDLLLAPSA